jgi:SAM-dependent methyltransferase
MSWIETIHGRYVHDRRTRVLSGHLAKAIPENVLVLDVGSGDGLLGQLISQIRSDVTIKGIDVLVRPHTHIPTEKYDGERIPYGDTSFDGVMFVDVLHHTTDPMILLREAARVARSTIVIKDHLLDGLLAGQTLRFMDRAGNARHGIPLPYNYWTKETWLDAFDTLGLRVGMWTAKLGLYPRPATWLFDRSLHFIARLDIV